MVVEWGSSKRLTWWFRETVVKPPMRWSRARRYFRKEEKQFELKWLWWNQSWGKFWKRRQQDLETEKFKVQGKQWAEKDHCYLSLRSLKISKSLAERHQEGDKENVRGKIIRSIDDILSCRIWKTLEGQMSRCLGEMSEQRQRCENYRLKDETEPKVLFAFCLYI